jgi:hypothetical protein
MPMDFLHEIGRRSTGIMREGYQEAENFTYLEEKVIVRFRHRISRVVDRVSVPEYVAVRS